MIIPAYVSMLTDNKLTDNSVINIVLYYSFVTNLTQFFKYLMKNEYQYQTPR